MNYNILLTAVGGDLSCSILKCLKESGLLLKVIGTDVNLNIAGKWLVDKFIISPDAVNEDEYKKFISDIYKEEEISIIIPASETEVMFFQSHRDYFEYKNIKVLIVNPQAYDAFADKYKTTISLNEFGIRTPVTYLFQEFRKELQYPFILKSRTGSGSNSVEIIHNDDEYEFYKKRTKDPIVQEFLDSDEEFTTAIYSDGNTVEVFSFKRVLGPGGMTFKADIVEENALLEISNIIAKKVSLKGLINMQTKKLSGAFLPFEINLRLSSTVYMRHHFGFCDAVWWVNNVLTGSIGDKGKYRSSGTAYRVYDYHFLDSA